MHSRRIPAGRPPAPPRPPGFRVARALLIALLAAPASVVHVAALDAQVPPAAPEPPGVAAPPTVLEGTPPGGFPYRLTMPAGSTEGRPSRLVIWLHPTGGSWNQEVEKLAPIFLKHHLSLLVITEKSFAGWTDEEARRLFGRTIPEVAGVSGIDARRPFLMGFSGGGQLAIALWHSRPGNYGGVILDAAYPIVSDQGKQELMEVPPGDATRGVPVFVLVGEKDSVTATWKKVEGKWRRAGVPLTVRYIPGKGHQWLFGPDEVAALDAWLGSLPASS
ncbi:MAG: hypothetical protein HY049_18180 [Acidobacteria bacterium]|nr:hypothetical protein [Acidobacteriota bacterium]